MSATVFSFIIPTRRRTEKLRRLLDSIKATTQNLAQLEIVLIIDQDDEESISFEYDGLRLKRVQVSPGLTMGALNMAGYKAATGEHLMLLNDDVVLRTPGWDSQVLAAFRSFPDGIVLVHVNDLLFRDTLATFPFVTREFCSLTGGVCPEGYVRYRIDDHIHNIFDLLSLLGRHRRVFLPDVIFEHTNISGPGEGSERYVPDPAIHETDTRLFDSLLPERKRSAVEAALLIEKRLGSDRRLTWEKKLDLVTDSVAIRHRDHARWFSGGKPSSEARVAVGVVSADLKATHARKCVELLKMHTANCDLILTDSNGDPNFNRSREMNRLLSICQTDYLVLMDDDVHVEAGWLEGMLRSIEPGVGVVTPLHKDRSGRLSYAGIVMRPDDTGHHSHILEAPREPRRIQTLSSAIMLIDVAKCGHICLDERYTKYFLDIDYGLRIWEEGFQVVCSPYSQVTHLAGATLERGGPRSAQLFEEQRRRYVQSWVNTQRIRALRQGVWSSIPEIACIGEKAEQIDRLFDQGREKSRDEFVRSAAGFVRSLESYPALKDYIAARARAALGERLPRADDPKMAHFAILLGWSGQPILYEAGFEGMNIVLQDFTYYALPQTEGPFSYERMAQNGYSRSFEAESVEALKSLIWRCRKGQVKGHVVERSSSAAGETLGPAKQSQPSTRAPGAASTEAPGLAGILASRNKAIAQLSAAVANRPKSTGGPRGARVPDASAHRSNPLVHFLKTGAYLGCRPNPLFDPLYYLSENPDVAAAGINPLAHYLEVGAQEGRRPNPLFDTAYYLEQNPDVAATGLNPLAQFLEVGAAQGRKPNPLFDTTYYLEQNPDVAAAGINPLVHYLEVGAQEGRRPNPLFDASCYLRQNPDLAAAGINPLAQLLEQTSIPHSPPNGPHEPAASESRAETPGASIAPRPRRAPLAPLSVVIPTYNRGELLSETLEVCQRNAGGCELEIIVIDNGSTDDTRQRLSELSASMPNLSWHSVQRVGPAQARNIGADAARYEVILFLGDDIRPENEDFFRVHASLHGRHADENLAVLGKVVWPRRRDDPITYTMAHIQGRGGEQFGYFDLTPYTFVSWPYFYTANVSVKKALVQDWILDGFDADFPGPAYEDLEFAYRLSKTPAGFKIFYDPTSLATHHHHYTLARFMDRQSSVGKALVHLMALHPELAGVCHLQDLLEALGAPGKSRNDLLVDYRLLVDGVKAWAKVVDGDHQLGSQSWHQEFLSAVLELCVLDGFVSAWPSQDGDLTAANAVIVDRFCRRMRQSLHHELADWSVLMGRLVPQTKS